MWSRSRHSLPGAGAGAAGTFVRSRSRQKRGGSGSERDLKLSKISKREMKDLYLQV